MTILVFGDSIAQGFHDNQGGWADRLKQSFLQPATSKDRSASVFNLGINGDAAENVVKRLALETRARLKGEEPVGIVIAVGINDSMVFKGVAVNSPEMFGGEMQQILAAARQYTDKLLFVGLTACDEAKTTPVAWGDFTYTNQRVWEFEQALRRFCRDNSLPLVKLFERFKRQPELLADGLHPNQDGHKLIADLVRPELDKLLA